MKMTKFTSFIFLLLWTCPVLGEVKLPAIISNNMVLQQQSEVSLWGEATPNHKVSITTSWNGQHSTTQSDAAGKWSTKVQTPEAGGPYKLTFDDGTKLTLTDVLIGEVWICSGQSNMEMPMRGFTNQPILHSNEIIMKAHEPQLRLFHVQRRVSNTPLDNCKGTWELSSPQAAATFSAVGFQFARKLQKMLKVPVGIIEAAWGGTPIKAWTDKKSLQPFPQLKIPLDDGTVKPGSQKPTCLFNGMINPIVGYGIKGFIWYQGEWDRRDAYLYRDLMEAMVKGWRSAWNKEDLSFYYVQIAPYDYKGELQDSVPLVREAQFQAMEVIPHSGMIVSTDVGSKNTIHPPDKTTIAKRLLFWALGDTYNWKGVSYKNPSFDAMETDSDAVTVSFTHAPLGLTFSGEKIKGFELAGADKVFYPAEAEIKGKGKVVLQSDEVAHPVSIRYLFKDWAEGNLFNTAGLPVAPFRTDDW